MPTARDTISGLHLGTALVAVAAARALHDGIERGQQLRAVDRAHEIGRARYVRAIKHKKSLQRAAAEDAVAALMRDRQRLHG